MPLFNLQCECGEFIEDKLCSYDTAKTIPCEKCGAIMNIVPVKNGGFKIFGYSADNLYTCDEMSYDGNPNPKW